MGYKLDYGLATPMKGAVLAAVRVSALNVANGSDCTIAHDASGGMVASVEHDALGVYILKLAQPYPPELVVCIPHIDAADGVTDILTARYDQGSYDATTGWLTINVSNDDDAGVPVAADGTATDHLHVLMVFERYTGL